MNCAIILNQADIKKIIAKYLEIDEKNIMKSQYSYTVTGITAEQAKKLKECGIE